MEVEKYVRSLAEGRLRLRHPALLGLSAEEMEAIRTAVVALEGILEVSINPSVGSALVLWDRHKLSAEELKGHLLGWLMLLEDDGDESLDEKQACSSEPAKDISLCAEQTLAPVRRIGEEMLDQAARVLAPNIRNIKRARRVTQNRIMLGLGGASVASLALNKGAHGALGWLFAAFALLHLWQHRRVL